MTRIVAGSRRESGIQEVLPRRETSEPIPTPLPKSKKDEEAVYWLTPVKATKEETAEECIQKLVGKERIYAFGENTPGRKRIKPEDWICFYANGNGVVAHAKVASFPEDKPHKAVRDSERYPWIFRLSDQVPYIDRPVVINAELRSQLEEFKGRDPKKSWAWYVQGTGKITEKDFRILTSHGKAAKAKAG